MLVGKREATIDIHSQLSKATNFKQRALKFLDFNMVSFLRVNLKRAQISHIFDLIV